MALSDPDVLRVRKMRQGHRVGGGSDDYEVSFSNGKSVFVANGAGSQFYQAGKITNPVDAYLKAVTVNIPKHISAHNIDPPVKPLAMSIYQAFDSTQLDAAAMITLEMIAKYYLFNSQRGKFSGILLEGNSRFIDGRITGSEYGERSLVIFL